jgi:hypothetical protein
VDGSSCFTRAELDECSAAAVASIRFAEDTEKIVSVTYPSPYDERDKRFNVLGDDSVLLKYINHHVVLVASLSPAEAAENPAACENMQLSTVNQASQTEEVVDHNGDQTNTSAVLGSTECKLHITLLDTVSAKVVYRLQHEHATGPVHSALIENYLVYSYWNAKVNFMSRVPRFGNRQ